jgi:separase
MALALLGAGARAVAGALWDVTDRDIDRLTGALLRRALLLPPPECEAAAAPTPVPLAEALAASRGVCRLPHLVGAAPVLYGLPLGAVALAGRGASGHSATM